MNRAVFTIVLAVAAPAVAQAADGELTLRLTCAGSIDDTTTVGGFFGPTKQHQQIPDQVDVEINGGTGRARVPQKFLPFFARVKDGWAEIVNLEVSDDAINGAVNLASQAKPKLHIDRRSGSLSLDGALGRFFGTCKAVQAGERAF